MIKATMHWFLLWPRNQGSTQITWKEQWNGPLGFICTRGEVVATYGLRMRDTVFIVSECTLPLLLPKVLILRNHGLVAVGNCVEECFHVMYNLIQACKIQVSGHSLH